MIFRRRFRRCGNNISSRRWLPTDHTCVRPILSDSRNCFRNVSTGHVPWCSPYRTSTSQYQSYSNHSLRRRPSSGGNTILRFPASTDHAPLFRRNSGNTDCRPPAASQSVLRCSDSNTSFRRSVPSRQGRREQDVPQKHFAGKYFFRKGFGHKSV